MLHKSKFITCTLLARKIFSISYEVILHLALSQKFLLHIIQFIYINRIYNTNKNNIIEINKQKIF